MVQEGVAALPNRPRGQLGRYGLLESMTLFVKREGVAEDKDPLVTLLDVPLDQRAYECRVESLRCSQALIDVLLQ
jgi:hypothetical protein